MSCIRKYYISIPRVNRFYLWERDVTVGRLEQVSRDAYDEVEDVHECRICLMEEGGLVRACFCRGSVGYVH